MKNTRTAGYADSRRLTTLLMILVVMIVFLFACLFGFSKKAVATDRTVKTYQSYTIQEGDSLWSMAMEYAPEEMDLSTYIQEVRQVNHLKTNTIISGESIILPIYTVLE
jgi:cell division protein YceG involved in septum cleavage